MPRGKAEVQFGHAISMLLEKYDPATRNDWTSGLQMKLSLEVDDLPALLRVRDVAERRGLPWVLVRDAGRTVFDGPTVTCIGVGPTSRTDSNAVTRGARMR